MIKTMQKRIEEIKQADRKAYYELANEIGISEYSLYSFMTRDECSANTENKINSYLRGYLTKDEKLESYRLDNEELKAENERLKARKDKYYQQTLDDEIQINELLHTLQEIKTIVEEDCEFCDDIGGCMDKECRRVRILNLITKAEEE